MAGKATWLEDNVQERSMAGGSGPAGSELDGETLETFVQHVGGDDLLDAVSYDVEEAFPDKVLADDQRDFPDRDAGLAGRIGLG